VVGKDSSLSCYRMEFDSPEVAKEFPGLYKSDGTKDMMMSDPAECK